MGQRKEHTAQMALIARLRAKPGRRDELLAALNEGLSAAEDEPGTLVYLMHTDDIDDDLVWFYELYTDDGAFEAHRTSETMRRIKPLLGEILAGPVDLVKGRLIGGSISGGFRTETL